MVKYCKTICIETHRDKLNLIWIYKIALLIFLGLMYMPSAEAGDMIIFSNSNKNAVQNLQTTTFQLKQPMLITRIETYHWNDQKGTSGPGKIGCVFRRIPSTHSDSFLPLIPNHSVH